MEKNIMETKEIIKTMKSKFTSGNNIPVTRSSITLEEWETIKTILEKSICEHKNLSEENYECIICQDCGEAIVE